MDVTDVALQTACPVCARPRTALDIAGLEWSSQHEPDGTVTWICGPCTRDSLWLIETLLVSMIPATVVVPTPVTV